MRASGAIFDRFIGFLFYMACILIGFSMLSVDVEIIYRVISGKAQLWVIEVSEYILLLMTFMGAAWVLKKDAHVKMDVLINRLEPKTQAILNMVTSIIGAVFILAIVWYGVQVVWTDFVKGTTYYKAVGFPRAPIILFIPLGSLLLFIQLIRRTRGYWREWRASRFERQKAEELALKRAFEEF